MRLALHGLVFLTFIVFSYYYAAVEKSYTKKIENPHREAISSCVVDFF
jgi:hypothetical protein